MTTPTHLPVHDEMTVTLDSEKTEEILRSCINLFTDFLKDDDEDKALQNIFETSVLIFNNFQADVPVACSKGCYYCCHQPVGINLAEARTIALYLPTLPDDVRADSLKRLKKMANVTPQKYGKTNLNKKYPCPFLHEDGSCRIYDVRPLSCRRYTSVSVDICKKLLAGDDSVNPSAIPLYKIIADLLAIAVHLSLQNSTDESVHKEYLLCSSVYYVAKSRGLYSDQQTR